MKAFTPQRLRRRVMGQLWQLGLQFLLGMALNLLGTDTKGALHGLYVGILAAHILNGIGLLEGNLYIAVRQRTRLSLAAFGSVTLALSAGILTEAMPGVADTWSFVMALGFLSAAWLNGWLYLRADRMLGRPNST